PEMGNAAVAVMEDTGVTVTTSSQL
ncbi:nicotinamidase, partial [Cutibacterium acnes]